MHIKKLVAEELAFICTGQFTVFIGGCSPFLPWDFSLSCGHRESGLRVDYVRWEYDIHDEIILGLWSEEARQTPINPLEKQVLIFINGGDQDLSPSLQVSLFDDLRKNYPNTQFIMYLDNPLALCNINPQLGDLVYRIGTDRKGKPCILPFGGDPRLMSTSQLFACYGGLEDLFPGKIGAMLQDYLGLASSPFRTDAEEILVWQQKAELEQAKVKLDVNPCKRKVLK